MQRDAAENVQRVAPPTIGPFYAFGFPNFRLFFVGQLISVAGSWMQGVAQQWLVFTLTHSAAWLGVVTGASAIPYVLFSMTGGQIADRHPRRMILVWTNTAAMILAFVLAALATNRWVLVQAWHIVVLAALSGIVNAFNMPAQQAFVKDMVEERHALANAIALNSLMFNMARFVGPVAAGIVLVKMGSAGCFFLNGLSFIAVIVSLMMMKLPPFHPIEEDRHIREAFHFIRENRTVLRTIGLVAGASLFAWSLSTLFPVFAARFHTGARGYTGLMAANGVGAALGGLGVAWFGHRFPRRTLLYGGCILLCASLWLFTFSPTYVIALVLLALVGFTMISFGINANTKVQEDVTNELRGRVMAVYSLVFMGLMPLGGLELGVLAEHAGSIAAVRINATACFIVALALLAWSRNDRKDEGVKG